MCRALEADSLLPTVRRRPGTGILMETSAPYFYLRPLQDRCLHM